jgi:hypothetical protein
MEQSVSALPSVKKKLLVQPNGLIHGIRRAREYAMLYEYDQESVLANGIYPVANAIEMDALLLLPGILLSSLFHDLRVPEMAESSSSPHTESGIPIWSPIINCQGERHHHFSALL